METTVVFGVHQVGVVDVGACRIGVSPGIRVVIEMDIRMTGVVVSRAVMDWRAVRSSSSWALGVGVRCDGN